MCYYLEIMGCTQVATLYTYNMHGILFKCMHAVSQETHKNEHKRNLKPHKREQAKK